MFRPLRLRLTGLYLLAGLALIALVGGGTHRLLAYYLQTSTDLALQHKMAGEFRLLGLPLPPELVDAERAWQTRLDRPVVPTAAAHGSDHPEDEHADDEERGAGRGSESEASGEEAYDGQLAAVFVLPLDAGGMLLSDPNAFAPPMSPDVAAARAALAYGSDWRTVRLGSGVRVRLLTYSVLRGGSPAVLQVGRTLADQDRVLNQLLVGLLAWGGASMLVLGAGSWWLAGRSLVPAQRAWERQQAFVANASHELRTPLTLLRASAEVALRGLDAADQDRRALLRDVLRECDHMSRLVDDLLLLSRLDAGQLKMERQAIALPGLAAELQRQTGRLAEERGVQLTAAADADAVAYGDPIRLRQVLLILLDNALRHTPPGGTVRLSARSRLRQVEISIADTGRGIAPDHLPHVFERFYRVDNPAGEESESNGSGLGLAIARALVEAQQGEIRLESRVGQGTIATLTLPAASDGGGVPTSQSGFGRA